jgi:probable selenium-dependent hydroxylase accessory protein YqeC
VSRPGDAPGKLKGIDRSHVAVLRRAWAVVLVEADGSRRLPVKAPAEYEPVVPEGTDLVVGAVGLDALGWPMDERTVHRPDRFAAVTGCAPGAPIGWDHVVALARHPEGLFKGARGRRVVLLNKVDESPYLPSPGQLAALGADLVLLSGEDAEGRFFFTARREPGS